jgi:hypothetical protein
MALPIIFAYQALGTRIAIRISFGGGQWEEQFTRF